MGCVSNKEVEKYKITAFKQQQEILLRLMYDDLAIRAKNVKLTKDNFITFFHLNGLWCHQIFKLFDTEKRGELTFQMFKNGIQSVYKCNYEKKIKALFHFYDIDKTNGVSYQELLKMLYSYPKQQLIHIIDDQKFHEALTATEKNYFFGKNRKMFNATKQVVEIQEKSEQEQADDEKPAKQKKRDRSSSGVFNNQIQIIIQNPKQDNNNDQNDRLKLPQIKLKKVKSKQKPQVKRGRSMAQVSVTGNKKFKITTNISLLVKKYGNFLFKEFNLDKEKQKLSLDHFFILIKKHQKIFASYFEGFHNYIWELNDNGKPQFLEMTSWIQSRCREYYIKQKELTERYIKFYRNTIFIFNDIKNKLPIEIKNMEGLYVEQYNLEQKKLFGFEIKHRDGIYPEKAFLFQSKQLKSDWLLQLSSFKKNSIHQKYEMQEKIGSGNYSVVYKGKQKSTNRDVAIKVIEKYRYSMSEKEVIKQQCKVLGLCNHPNIVQFIQTIESKSHIYIIIELLNEGNLQEYVKKKSFLEQFEAAIVMKQLIQTIIFINSLGLIHRDLKPENIMLRMNKESNSIERVKIIDFGFAVYKDNLKNLPIKEKYAGTPNFVAPEVIMLQQFDEKVDNFSLGVIMYFMLSGNLPFDSIFEDEITQNTKQCKIELQNSHWMNVSESGKDLLKKLIAFQQDRISLDQAINHPWVAQRHQLKDNVGKNKKNKYM